LANNHLLDFNAPSWPNTFSHSLFVRALELAQRNLPPHVRSLILAFTLFFLVVFSTAFIQFNLFSLFYSFTLYQENTTLFITKQQEKMGYFKIGPLQ